jgi:hypothetical protein
MGSLVHPRELEFLEAPSALYEAAQALRGRLSQAMESIKIFSGEAHWMLYSHPFVIEALRDRHRCGVEIHFIASPVLSVCERNGEKHLGLLDLAEEQVIKLYQREKRGRHQHFTIIDDKLAWIENHHLPLSPLYERSTIEVRVGSPKFEEIFTLFSTYLNRLAPSVNPRAEFILLTPYQIHSIVKSGVDYDELTRDDFQKFLEKFEEEGRKAKEIAIEIGNKYIR